MTKSTEETIEEYTTALADGDFVQEFQEGSNRGRFMTPRDMLDLVNARQKMEAEKTRRSKGIFRRVVD
jgi:hypothetical protein